MNTRNNTIFNIINAEYGIRGNSLINVTEKIKYLIKNNSLVIDHWVNLNQLFEVDPIPGSPKKLYITYNLNDIIFDYIYDEMYDKLTKSIRLGSIENHIFIHVCLKNNGKQIFFDQLENIKNTQLLDKTKLIHVGVLSETPPMEFIIEIKALNLLYNDKIKIEFIQNKMNLWEYPTLTFLYDYALKNINIPMNFLYLHTKGVNACNDAVAYNRAIRWRKYMEYFLLNKHNECLNSLNNGTTDTIGVDFKKKPWPHYSGNFWWTTSEYIIHQCSPLTMDQKDRFGAEKWLLAPIPLSLNPLDKSSKKALSLPVNRLCLHNSNTNHYKHSYKESKYK